MTRPVIGSKYVAQFFERRSDDRQYTALRPTLEADELRVQQALLASPTHRQHKATAIVPGIGAFAVLATLLQ